MLIGDGDPKQIWIWFSYLSVHVAVSAPGERHAQPTNDGNLKLGFLQNGAKNDDQRFSRSHDATLLFFYTFYYGREKEAFR